METRNNRLNAGQIAVLYLLYRYRFATADQLALALGKKDGRFLHNRLKILMGQELVGRRFESGYRLLGKPAAYFLLPTAFKALQDRQTGRTSKDPSTDLIIDQRVRKRLYKDKKASDQFIQHSLAIFSVGLWAMGISNEAKFYTNSDFVHYDYFPQSVFDGFLSLGSEGMYHRYFIAVFEEGTERFVIVQKILQIIKYQQSGKWERTKLQFPGVLFVCANQKELARINKRVQKMMEDNGVSNSEMPVASTTFQELLQASANSRVWINPTSLDPNERVSLFEIV